MKSPPPDDGLLRAAGALVSEADVIDLHVDSFIWTRIFGYDLFKEHGLGPLRGWFLRQVDFPRAKKGGMTGATWVITTNPFRTAKGRRRAFERNIERLRGIFAEHAHEVAVVRNVAEYRAARAAKKHGAFVGIQGGNALDDGVEALESIPDDLVLRVTLVHLSTSSLGVTSSPANLSKDTGLTDFGRQYIERLNEKKIFVDLAHISRKGFFDAIEVHDETQPLLVTHTGVCGVRDHWRNLTDEQIVAVANTGGTIGIMFQSTFLGPSLFGKAQWVVDHMQHIIDVAGEDYVSLGSDWDGAVVPPQDLKTPLQLTSLVSLMLKQGWTDERIRKVLGGNFLRVVEQLRG